MGDQMEQKPERKDVSITPEPVVAGAKVQGEEGEEPKEDDKQ